MPFSSVIAIDGPSGSGKSTVAKEIAQKLNILYIDTGAMFRALAYCIDKDKINTSDSNEVNKFLNNIKVEYQSDKDSLIKVDGKDLSIEIREHHVSLLASGISQVPEIRAYLLKFQRELAMSKTCVMEGRDIGSVVFPDAFCKLFVTASIEVRAKRRLDQLVGNGQKDVDINQLMEDVKSRDDKDINRDEAPLIKTDDATLIDTSNMTFADVIDDLIEKIKLKACEVGISL